MAKSRNLLEIRQKKSNFRLIFQKSWRRYKPNHGIIELKTLKELRTEFRTLAIKEGWANETITVSLVDAFNRTNRAFHWLA